MVYEWRNIAQVWSLRKFGTSLRGIGQSWFWPPLCPLCGGLVHGTDLCEGCVGALPYVPRVCRRCALPLGAGDLCAACLQRPPPFDEAVCPFLYASPVDAMIQRLKFRGGLDSARILGALLAEAVVRCTVRPPDVIVPVPLHRGRLWQRGYNQALELARPVAARLRLPIERDVCRRARATAEQSGLAAGARRENVRGAFHVEGGFGVREVAIVDDVMTTGHTVAALARALRGAGVERIAVWTCARSVAGFM